MRRLAMLAALFAVALVECAPARPRRAADGIAPPQPHVVRVPMLSGPPVTEESLGEEPAETPAADNSGTVPSPATILANVTAGTPPRVATSLRLTDEGRRLLDEGQTEAALDRLETAMRMDPNNPHAYYWLAQLHYRGKRFDQAIAFADKAAVLFNRSDGRWASRSYAFKGSVLEQVGRYGEARDSYRVAVEIEAGNVAALAGLSRLSRDTLPPRRAAEP